MLLSLAPAPEIIGVIRSYAIPEESMSLMKAPLDVVHRIGGLEMETEEGLLTEEDTLGGWTMERLAGDSDSGIVMVPPPL